MAPSQTNPEAVLESKFGVPDLEALAEKFGWPRENSKGYRLTEQLCGTERPLRVIHVGAGASAICFAKFLPEKLKNVTLTCYDKNSEIGGTWLENRYPGCACDIPSANYQFTWAHKPNWSHFYSYSEEIWQYFRDVVDRFDLMKYMVLNHQIMGAYWHDDRGVWEVEVKNLITGETFIDTAEVVINGGGVLNKWKWPEIEGLHDFTGKLCHTAHYDTTTVLDGKRVAVIGVGSSGIQVTSNIASRNHAGPNGANFAYSPEQKIFFRDHPLEYLKYCKEIENELNQRFKFILNGTPEAEEAKKFSTEQMRIKLKGREDLIKMIIPTNFGVGCRRPTPGNGFLEALTMPHVKTFGKEMQRITPGFIDHEGLEHKVDVIICATGFDTSWVPRFPIVANGKNVQDIEARSPISYLSIGVPEIPNYWTVTGPYGPLGHGSIVPIFEILTNHFIKCIKRIQTHNIKSLTPRLYVCEAFVEHANQYLKRTAWTSGCSSWFKQGKVDGPLTMFSGTRLVYIDLLTEPRYEDYKIEYQSGNPFGYLGNGFSIIIYDGSDLSYYLGTEKSPGGILPDKLVQQADVNSA